MKLIGRVGGTRRIPVKAENVSTLMSEEPSPVSRTGADLDDGTERRHCLLALRSLE